MAGVATEAAPGAGVAALGARGRRRHSRALAKALATLAALPFLAALLRGFGLDPSLPLGRPRTGSGAADTAKLGSGTCAWFPAGAPPGAAAFLVLCDRARRARLAAVLLAFSLPAFGVGTLQLEQRQALLRDAGPGREQAGGRGGAAAGCGPGCALGAGAGAGVRALVRRVPASPTTLPGCTVDTSAAAVPPISRCECCTWAVGLPPDERTALTSTSLASSWSLLAVRSIVTMLVAAGETMLLSSWSLSTRSTSMTRARLASASSGVSCCSSSCLTRSGPRVNVSPQIMHRYELTCVIMCRTLSRCVSAGMPHMRHSWR